MKAEEAVPKYSDIAIWAVWAWLFTLILMLLFSSFDFQKAGQMGDMFGMLNCLFTGLGFAGIYVNLRQQNQIVRHQIPDMRVAFASNLLAATSKLLVANLEILHPQYPYTDKPDWEVFKNMPAAGMDTLISYYKTELNRHDRMIGKLDEEIEREAISIMHLLDGNNEEYDEAEIYANLEHQNSKKRLSINQNIATYTGIRNLWIKAKSLKEVEDSCYQQILECHSYLKK